MRKVESIRNYKESRRQDGIERKRRVKKKRNP